MVVIFKEERISVEENEVFSFYVLSNVINY